MPDDEEYRKTAAGLMAASTMGSLALEFIAQPGVYESWVRYENMRRTPAERQGTPPGPEYVMECSRALLWLATTLMDEEVVLRIFKEVTERLCSNGGDGQ